MVEKMVVGVLVEVKLNLDCMYCRRVFLIGRLIIFVLGFMLSSKGFCD